MDNPALSCKQAAEYLGFTIGTLSVYRARKIQPIPYYKLGKKVMYRKADLDAYLALARVE